MEKLQGGSDEKSIRAAFLKPDEHGQVTDEAIAAFLQALGIDPITAPKTRAEAERIRRELRRQRQEATDD